MHLPSAGPNRVRFNGFACASQPFRAPRGITDHIGPPRRRKDKGGIAAQNPVPRRRLLSYGSAQTGTSP